MSENLADPFDGAAVAVDTLLARAAASEARVRAQLTGAIVDLFLPEEARLDERTRAALARLLSAMIATVERDVRGHAARTLAARDHAEAADMLAQSNPVEAQLAQADLLRDPDLIAELMGRVRHDQMVRTIPRQALEEQEGANLVGRLSQHADAAVSQAAIAVLVAESRRRGFEANLLSQTDLPAELHHRLVWWVAAALRAQNAGRAGAGLAALDHALVEAAQRSLTAHDEGGRLEAASMRLAAALSPDADALPEIMVEALGDRRVALFTALMARALGLEYTVAADIIFDADGDRMWLALRALGLEREMIARIGYALCEADPRRDLESFADLIDTIVAIDQEAAKDVLAPLRLPPAYRAAQQALGGRA